MRKILHRLILILLCLPVLRSQAKDIIGFMTGNGNPESIPIGIYRFDSETLQQEMLSNMMVGFWGGAYAADKYYLIYSSDYQGYIYNGLSSFDIDSRTLDAIAPSQPYQCSDMTYDVTTGTMYGLQIKYGGEDIDPTLISIDLKNGMSTDIGTVSTPIAAIACNNWGELYGMGYNGNLYSIDKQSGALVLIGNTDIATDQSQAQSMEFDRETGILYWSCLSTAQDALLVRLNIYSNSPVIEQKVMKNNALIVGLHIPVTPIAPQAPAAPEQLKIKSANGKAILTWTNPSKTYTGQELTQLTRIEIVRNNEIIHTIENPVPGAEMTWEDASDEIANGNFRYALYGRNDAGRSEGISKKLIVGDDVPGIVTDFKLTALDNKARLTWTAPAIGKNGGELTPENLRYTLTRFPDRKEFTDISGTSFTDETIETPAYYSYHIVCYNKTGKGNEAVSAKTIVGQPITVPYTTDFSNELLAAQWKVVDANQDQATWTWQDGKFVYPFCFSQNADDHLISVPFSLEKGVNYAVKYTIHAPNMFSSPEHFTLKMGEQVLDDLKDFNNEAPEERTVTFTVAESGNYSFTLSAYSPKDNWQIVISNFSVEKMVAKDLALTTLTTDTERPQEGKAVTVSASVTNYGIEDATSYQVVLTDQNQKVLATQTLEKILTKNATETVNFEWNPDPDVTAITATVKMEGDLIDSNNSMQKKVYILGENESYVSVGEKSSQPDWFPFAFDGKKYSYSQAIYLKKELNLPTTQIKGICYDYNNMGNVLQGKHVRIYMSNTTHSNLQQSGWFDESEMTLVFDGFVDFEKGKHTLFLFFDQPFSYNGQNLAVYNQKLNDDSKGDIYFYAKNYEGNVARTALYMDNSPEVYASLVKGSTMLNHITFRIKNINTGIDEFTTRNDDYGMTLNGNLLSLDRKVSSITIYNMNGQLIEKASQTQTVHLSDCAPGIYVVNITDGQQQISRKIIKK